MQNLITVPEAAALANVTVKTIYYHIHKSHKLQLVWGNKRYYVNATQLKQLYPATKAGTKQHISNVTYNNSINVNANTQQQARELIAQAQAVIAQLQTVLVV